MRCGQSGGLVLAEIEDGQCSRCLLLDIVRAAEASALRRAADRIDASCTSQQTRIVVGVIKGWLRAEADRAERGEA